MAKTLLEIFAKELENEPNILNMETTKKQVKTITPHRVYEVTCGDKIAKIIRHNDGNGRSYWWTVVGVGVFETRKEAIDSIK